MTTRWKDPEIAAIREMLSGMGDQPPPRTPEDFARRRAGMDAMGDMAQLPAGHTVQAIQLAGRAAERHLPAGGDPDRVLLYLHGGAYCLGSPKSHRGLAAELAAAAGVSAVVPDYRLAPENPYPAAVDDALAVYRALLDEGVAAERIVVAGDSAGGGLALALALAARDAGLPQPAALFLISPWTSMTPSGPSYVEKDASDPMIKAANIAGSAADYLAGVADAPYASPARADFTGLAPMLIHVGSEETILSDSILAAERAGLAGVAVRLEVWPEMIHVWHAFYALLGAGRAAIGSGGAWIRERLA